MRLVASIPLCIAAAGTSIALGACTSSRQILAAAPPDAPAPQFQITNTGASSLSLWVSGICSPLTLAPGSPERYGFSPSGGFGLGPATVIVRESIRTGGTGRTYTIEPRRDGDGLIVDDGCVRIEWVDPSPVDR